MEIEKHYHNNNNNALVLGLLGHKDDYNSSTKTSTSTMNYVCVNEDQDCRENGITSLSKSLAKIEEVIQEKSIDQVIGLSDSCALLHSVLVDRYPDRFQGPSLKSVFLANNKYYTRQYLDPNPISFCHIDLSQPLTREDLEKAVTKVGLPAIMKPSGGGGSYMIKKITSLEDLENFLDELRKNYRPCVQDSVAFVAERLAGEELGPMDCTDGFVLKQFVETKCKVSVDGYICNKEIVHWTIGDNCYWPIHPDCFKMTCIPTELSGEIQKNIWNYFDQVAERLIHYGYNNGFVNQEFFVYEDGSIRLMEVNPRPTMAFCKAYCEVLHNGNYIDTCLQINRGIRPKDPDFEGKCLAFVPMNCMISGKIEDIVDFEAVDSLPNVSCKVTRDKYIKSMGDSGIYILIGNLVGSSREELLRKHEELYEQLFKIHPMGNTT